MRRNFAILTALLTLPGIVCGDAVTDWNQAFLRAVQNETTPPCLASRNPAILHIAIYDAVNAVTRTHQPYCFKGQADGEVSLEAAASGAAHQVAIFLYPSRGADFDTLLTNSLRGVTNETSRAIGLQLGRQAADAILALRSDDGASTTVAYIPSNTPGRWRRTPPFFRPPELPQWRLLKPFAMTNTAQFRPAPPPALDSPRYAEELNEVKRLGGLSRTERTAEQTQIAHFWSDFSYTVTPPGHWNDIARDITSKRKPSLVETARLFALLNIATADSAILCWDAKYEYDFWRPVTAISRADEDGNAATVAVMDWLPLLPTPAHPEYPSGHSTFSGAAAAVLTSVIGSEDVSFSVGCDALPGVNRSYENLWTCAKEISMSRIYGGIHFLSAGANGLKAGRLTGEFVVGSHLQPLPP